MAATEPFSFQAILTSPEDDGAPQTSVEALFSGNFTKKSGFKLELTSTGTHSVGMGSVGSPGAKGVLIEYQTTAVGQSPVMVTFNGADEAMEISPGGFLAYCNPNPVAGIESIDIAHTSDCTLRIRVLG